MERDPPTRNRPKPDATPVQEVTDLWLNQLRKQERGQSARGPPQLGAGAGAGRDRSRLNPLGGASAAAGGSAGGGTAYAPNTTTLPLLSTGQRLPPNSNVSRHPGPSYAPLQPPFPARPSRAPTAHHNPVPSSSGPPPPHHHTSIPSRHRDQQDRIYADAKYDAEFDRGHGGPPNARAPAGSSGLGGAQQLSNHGPRGLFNPNSNVSSVRQEEVLLPPVAPFSRSHVRSKREPVEAADLGGKRGKESQSKESLESEGYESGGNGNGTGRPGSRSSKEGRHRRRREGDSARRRGDEGAGEASSSSLQIATGGSPIANTVLGGGNGPTPPSTAAAPRQLFDPRRDDPVRFATRAGGVPSRMSTATTATTASDARSFVGSILSVASSATSISETGDMGEASSRQHEGTNESNTFVLQLKRAYKDITDIETKLQDEHRAMLAAAAREEESGAGVRIQGGGKKYNDEYWVRLATSHKQLADAHYSFLQMALDPRQPASLHTLPQRYNIPQRLWQTGFRQLIEQMRHAVTTSPPSPDASTNVLEHLIEFSQYAYGHYSQLFEDPMMAPFRSPWIEALGDLARYRMAIAALASRVSAAQNQVPTSRQQQHFSGSNEDDRDAIQKRAIDAASIGDAALGDWEIEEHETWRDTARDWYGQGLFETPGNGRLQHHLALLSKGDELKGLYHYCKSLTASHPYLSARESILPLFEDEHQARRTQPDVTKAELFVHLHGMLFTKISLDDFDECLERFLERLTEEACLLSRVGGDWSSIATSPPFGDAEWSMIGVINIASLLQYGADEGVLKTSSTNVLPTPASSKPSPSSIVTKAKVPQSIMLNPSSVKRPEDEDSALDGLSQSPPPADVVMQLSQPPTDEDPLVFRLAQRLTFRILDLILQYPYRIVDGAEILNPYITLVLTFVSQMAFHPAALRHLERSIPWNRLASFFNSLPPSVEVRMDAPTKLTGGPLPEDWSVRGMDWTGKNLFGRGYWKPRSSSGAASTTTRREEPQVIQPPLLPGTFFESEMQLLKFDLETLEEKSQEFETGSGSPPPGGEGIALRSPCEQIALGRWRRIATAAAWFARNVPGFDFDAKVAATGGQEKFKVGGHLEAKLRRWKKEDEQELEEARRVRISKWDEEDGDEGEVEEEETDEEDDDDEDSVVVRELKARRRQLKAVMRQARESSRKPTSMSQKPKGSKRASRNEAVSLQLSPGYTVLVFDTNVILAALDLFRKLLETETWTIVVPLAGEFPFDFVLEVFVATDNRFWPTVITELDGLKKNATALGAAAVEAIAYLEVAIRSYSRYLKIQTSRGNYLKDLTIRSENIDFAEQQTGDLSGGFSHDFARNMDDVILRAVSWQREHYFTPIPIANANGRERPPVPPNAAKVVLVTGDRNLRLKARARGLDVTNSSQLKKENG